MEFRFWKSKNSSAQNASSKSADTEETVTSSKGIEAEKLSASPELTAEINDILGDVKVNGAEAMQGSIYDAIRQVMGQLNALANGVLGREVMRLYASNKHNDHVMIGFGDGSAISIRLEVSILEALDEAEGRR